ncbi:Nickel transport system permease protein NikB [Saezia sanguinis]|jgi:peptide/nickel transport system permease protein|uniref:Nickel transport system permease protein NikB n=1 Tax=Saezia sanguinis TaxID=1965230 RepID=A0A433SCF0_9BURK|nr:ABC transporter permease [Saezia sanguinis]RUS66314.1 Nickel transport system permease protein NikB [Saezia sanguinis]
MLAYIIRRILQAMLVMLVMSALVFCGLYMVGDPVAMMASPEATELERAAIRQNLGLDQPLVVQYLHFLGQALQLNFGNSFHDGEPAMKLILQRMPATLELATVAMLISLLIGIPLGIWAGLKPNALSSRGIMSVSTLGFSLPNFWIGLMFIILFAVYLKWLPSGGRGPVVSIGPIDLSILTLEGWKYILLPAFTIACAKAALIIRVTRAATREALPMEYIKFARAKGVPRGKILRTHLLKNILIPIITIAGLEYGQVIAFAVVTETIFSWPGMGQYLIQSIQNLDRPIVVAYLILIVFLLVMLNLIVDVLYSVLDPRVRVQGAKS